MFLKYIGYLSYVLKTMASAFSEMCVLVNEEFGKEVMLKFGLIVKFRAFCDLILNLCLYIVLVILLLVKKNGLSSHCC
jgi:hypothetical protein